MGVQKAILLLGVICSISVSQSIDKPVHNHVPQRKLERLVATDTADSDAGTSLPLAHVMITSGFGWRTDPITGRESFHKGIDLRAKEGADIYAAAGGRVAFAGDYGGYGKLVVVDHGNNFRTMYGHCSEIEVSTGERIIAGQLLGRVGQTGRTTGPHLHFEVRVGREAIG